MRDIMLILHFVGLAMGLGTSFAFMLLGMAASKMEKEEGRKFSDKTEVISRMGHIGLALLIITGIVLMNPYWAVLSSMPLLVAKLVLVVVLAVLIGIIGVNARKAKETKEDKYYQRIQVLGKLSFLTAVAIVVLAVYNFH